MQEKYVYDNTQENIEIRNGLIEIEQEAKPADKKSTIINFLIIIAIMIGLLIYMIKVDGIDNIIAVLKAVDYKWVVAGLGCLMLYWVCEGTGLHIPIKKLYPNQKWSNSVRIAMIGQLFNNLTPFASGGQPMQAYEFTKTGKRASDSFSAMAIKFIINQTAIVITTLIIMLFEFSFFKELLKSYFWVALLGFAINIGAIILVILAGVKKKIIKGIINSIIKFLGKIHIIKHPDRRIEKLDKSIDNFAEQFKVIKTEKKMVIQMFIVSIVQCMAYYSITYMVYRAFGNSGITFFQIIPVQAFLLLILMFVPTPGSGLGAEGGFYMLFNKIFKEGTINMSILFWRIYTFYLPILVGLLCMISIKRKTKRD